MAVPFPIEVGARGTVGSLIQQEIDYFSKLELASNGIPKKPESQITDITSTSNGFQPKFGFMIMASKKKKGGTTNIRLLPSICSLVEAADSNRPNGVPNFSYRNLKTDVKNVKH
ncbi:uncharacterized protein LOC122645016 [Telopea speciosissima]|uniref:uncharacterized protein LOC122645016 n=1 Tax=Telopea speciosissima TaxID=54955 RepID=UPI001CC6B080|nr:uncharacterized protein LOC122645016 [Telopea speciosissima]